MTDPIELETLPTSPDTRRTGTYSGISRFFELAISPGSLIAMASVAAVLLFFQEPLTAQGGAFLAGSALTALAFSHLVGKRQASGSEKLQAIIRERNQAIEQYETLANNVAAALLVRDSAGRLVFCSPYTEVLTGYSRKEIYELGDDFFHQVIHEEDRPIYHRALKVSAYGEAFQFRCRFFHRTGLQMWAETRTVPILDQHGVVISSLSIMLDITSTALHQKQAEEVNQDLHDFTYMVSHDLKAPIATIKGMMNLLQEEGRVVMNPECQEALDYIGTATVRLEQLVASVVEYARVSTTAPEREVVQLDDVMHDLENDFTHQLSAVGGTLEIAPNLPAILGERIRIYQIFSNLVSNSIKYCSPDRPLVIRITQGPAHSRRNIALRVSDNGIGIPEGKRELAFRPFARLHPDHAEGSGIGLACVKKLTEKLGGEIRITKGDDDGTSFELLFMIPQHAAPLSAGALLGG